MRRSRRRHRAREQSRFTVDASVFVNAFNAHEEGHAGSFAFLDAVQRHGDPIIVPTLLLPEVAAALSRASHDPAGALQYAAAAAALPHVTLVALTPALARQAAELAATHRLRGADAVYVAVAKRYGTVLVSCDVEQRSRSGAVIECETPDEALAARPAALHDQHRGGRQLT
jgi:predicted nucleic acid-binding protein